MQKIVHVYLPTNGGKVYYKDLDDLLSQGWVVKQMSTTSTGGEGLGAYIVVLLEK